MGTMMGTSQCLHGRCKVVVCGAAHCFIESFGDICDPNWREHDGGGVGRHGGLGLGERCALVTFRLACFDFVLLY